MLNIKYEIEYDAELNIVFNKCINKPLTTEDMDHIIEENERWYKKGGQNKVWNIADLSEMGMVSMKLVKYYQQKEKPLNEKYLIDYCVVCSKTMEKIATQLFNILMGRKNPIFRTREEAIDWILNEQETRGKFIPLEYILKTQ